MTECSLSLCSAVVSVVHQVHLSIFSRKDMCCLRVLQILLQVKSTFSFQKKNPLSLDTKNKCRNAPGAHA